MVEHHSLPFLAVIFAHPRSTNPPDVTHFFDGWPQVVFHPLDPVGASSAYQSRDGLRYAVNPWTAQTASLVHSTAPARGYNVL